MDFWIYYRWRIPLHTLRNRKKANNELVKDYTLACEVSQRSDSLYVLDLIAKFLGCGKVYSESRGIKVNTSWSPKRSNIKYFSSLFTKYPLEGNKSLQYKLWMQIVEILQTTGRS